MVAAQDQDVSADTQRLFVSAKRRPLSYFTLPIFKVWWGAAGTQDLRLIQMAKTI